MKMRKSEDIAFGRVIRELRLARGLTQQQLGNAVSMSYQQIQKYETGANRVAISTLFGLANCLGMTPSDLLLKVEHQLNGTVGE
ncbi:hypothetical protein GCM10011390_10490 [Aureimonas endophytica]|uniref:HTH cro/C1-type domain-containing protein n=1 Tax=Aureimonas endophytica TaxID=2027858 RepID=A0A916ZFN8_9HYPH|nr:helix-turn-helix transcriptional regulator [Aureimonas endophytica]GGD93649.1 hypothetical protein GCM10011390_10490 [Aureimonas endophytica]